MKYLSLLVILVSFWASSAFAGEADVLEVKIKGTSKNTYSFTVTVLHEDTGWDHYANKWDIVDEKGNVIGTRILHHPHVAEQPFSRSLSGVKIPEHIKSVTVRAHDSIHEYGGKTFSLSLP